MNDTATTVQAPGPHLTSDEVREMIRDRRGKREITDRCAATIASWWQSPGVNGHIFATLASGLPVDRQRLLDDIHRTYVGDISSHDKRCLDMLATWALNGGEE
jgi:hypothetical protein